MSHYLVGLQSNCKYLISFSRFFSVVKMTAAQQNRIKIRESHTRAHVERKCDICCAYSAVQSQKAVSAHFTSKHILAFAFADE